MNHRKTFLAAALAAACIGSVSAKTEVFAQNNEIEFAGLNPSASYQLEIKLPSGALKSIPFDSAEILSISASDLGLNNLTDGQYKYQIRTIKQIKTNRTEQTAPSEAKPSLAKPNLLSGVFTVKNGTSVIDSDDENVIQDQQILDDQIVVGSQCVGQDCVNGESFGFDTIRLKENNLRIKFQDTSASASFPSNDWQITANDTSNGGANKFSIDDVDGGRTPFTLEAGAPSHSLYVDDGGRVGFGTSTPVVENHIASGDTPTVRLEQNGSNGWTPQIWDVAGNESGFFVRDATNGSKLSFRIEPNSPAQSVFIKTDGIEFFNNTTVLDNDNRLGLGTNDPKHPIHIATSGGNSSARFENLDTGKAWKLVNKSTYFEISQVGSGSPDFYVSEDGEMKVKSANTGNVNLMLDENGNMTISGALSQNSDVHTKENINLINTNSVLKKVMALPISVWNYKFDDASVKHLGPMAQDFYRLFNLGASDDKISAIDTTGVALAAIQELGAQVNEKNKILKELQVKNKKLEDRLKSIEDKLSNN